MIACVNEQITEMPNGGEISFEKAFLNNSTRVGYENSDQLTAFEVWGFVKQVNGVIFDGTTVTRNGDAWTYSGTQYWAPEQHYYFAALAPVGLDITPATDDASAKLGLGILNFENTDGKTDVIYAQKHIQAATINQPNAPISLNFGHLLSKVKFSFTNGFNTDVIYPTVVEVSNVTMKVPSKGSINLATEDPKWEVVGNNSTILEFGVAGEDNELLTIPADATQSYEINYNIRLSINGVEIYNEDKTSIVAGVEFKRGHAYNFTANVSPETLNFDEIKFDVIEVDDWTQTADTDIPVGGDLLIVPNNQIWYTSTDGEIIELYRFSEFYANIASHTYENGKGVITFDSNVTSIGNQAFLGCSSLASITIPDSVTSIGSQAFLGCSSLASITIPDSVTSIEDNTFNGCSSLASITIPNSVTSIGNYAFGSCSCLESVIIPNNVNSITGNPFAGCQNLAQFKGKFASVDGKCLIINGELRSFAPAELTEYTILNGITSIGESAFEMCSLASITIPDSVISIGKYAFQNCSSLASITIPDSVTSVEYAAFNGCSSLASITIPNSITSIEDYTFYGCSSLASITIPDSVTLIGHSAFRNCSRLSNITIPNSVTSIGKSAFQDCKNLSSITIPDGVTSIEHNTFWGCSSLTSVIIPDSVTSIGDSAFRSCSCLTSITIPSSVTSIEGYTFCDCSSLASITIPDSVTLIGHSAFRNCTSLAVVYCKPTTPPVGRRSMFNNNASGRKIYVPAESVDAYKSAEYWSDYASDIVDYDFSE